MNRLFSILEADFGVAAFHEAGHAIAALHERRQVNYVGLSAEHPGAGVVYFSPAKPNPYSIISSQDSALAAWEYSLKTTRSDLKILLAGPLAEAKALGKPLRALGAYRDLDTCAQIGMKLAALHDFVREYADIPPINITEEINAMRQKTRKWVGVPTIWSQIECVADVLIQYADMEREEFHGLAGQLCSIPRQQQLWQWNTWE